MKTLTLGMLVLVCLTSSAVFGQDTTPPQAVSAGSLDGTSIGVFFNEPLDSLTANDATYYSLSDGAFVDAAALQADGTTVLLTVSGLASPGFTLTVNGVQDVAGNAADAEVTGQVLGLTPQDLGSVAAPGLALSCAPGWVDVWARGQDIWGPADSGHIAWQERTGDFDVRVQVQSFLAPAPDANAGLMARETMDAGSRNFSICVYANQANWTAVQRIDLNGASSVLPGNWRINWPEGAGYPNVWVRLKRVGNTFTTYGANNGMDWTQIGESVTPATPYADTLLVGPRTTPVEVEVAGSTAVAQYRNYGDYVITNATITMAQQPAGVTILENTATTFSAVAQVTGAPADELLYQWQKDEVDIPGARSASYTTPLAPLTDNGAIYRVKVSLPGGVVSVLSQEAKLIVRSDIVPPGIVSAGSLDGYSVAVRFSEIVDGLTANDASLYGITGATVDTAALQADGTTVLLTVSGLTGASFTLAVNGVQDLAGNAAHFEITGQVLGLAPQDLGSVAAPGLALSLAPGWVDVWARGQDIWGAADSGQFVWQERTGDFDVRVQVQSFQSASFDANAGLMARETMDAGSRNMSIVVYANQANWTATQRIDPYGASSVLPGNWRINWPEGAGYTNVWVRLNRVGNTFTTYGGTNGTDWTRIGESVTPAPPYADTLLVGLRTTPVEVEVAGSTAVAQYRNYGDYAITNDTITIVQQPANTVVLENATATFAVVVTGASPGNLSYQWQRDEIDIPGAASASYTTPLLALTDDGAIYRVKVSLPGGVIWVLSQDAILSVRNDIIPPEVVSLASLDGTSIGVFFNEPLDPLTANDPLFYLLSDGAYVDAAALQADGTTVLLTVSGLTGPSFTLTLNGVLDLVGNAAYSEVTGQVLGLVPQDLGSVAAPGLAFSCAPGWVDVWARGQDIWGPADSGHFVWQERTGDFDVRVQVKNFQSASFDANAGLMVRETMDAGSRNFSICVYANQANWTAVQRVDLNGASSVLPGNWRINWPEGVGYTNIWVRLKRAGNTFTTFGGSNGIDWIQIGNSVTTATPYADTLLVGPRTTPVEVEVAGSTAVVQYRNYGDFVEQIVPQLMIARSGAASLTLSWPATGTEGFKLEWKNTLGAGDWTEETTSPSILEGTKTVTLSIETSGAKFFRLRR